MGIPTARRQRNIFFFLLLAVLVLGVATAGWLISSKNKGPLPKKIVKSVNFAVYYPSPLPAGYSLDKQSPAVDSNILFFSLSSGDKKVSISEQAGPKSPPEFDLLQKSNTSFKKLDVIAGQAIMGLDQASQAPVAIVETNTTLINVSGSRDTPLDIISKMAQSLASLPQ